MIEAKVSALATTRGREYALAALRERRKVNSRRKASWRPYCISCAQLVSLPSRFPTIEPDRLCPECQAMKDLDWLTE